MAYITSIKCDKCKKLGMQEVKKEEVDRYTTTKTSYRKSKK